MKTDVAYNVKSYYTEHYYNSDRVWETETFKKLTDATFEMFELLTEDEMFAVKIEKVVNGKIVESNTFKKI